MEYIEFIFIYVNIHIKEIIYIYIYVCMYVCMYKGLRKSKCMVFINLKDNEKPTDNK